jgi:hypothetical protein
MNRSIIPFKAVCAAALLATMSSLGFAQSDYPSRPIKIVVPLPPGPVLTSCQGSLPKNWRSDGGNR